MFQIRLFAEFDFSEWAADTWHRVTSDEQGATHALLTLIALCLCKIAFGRKQRSKASLDLPAGECGYIQVGEDAEEEDATV